MSKLIVIIGQSNGVRMSPYLKSIMPKYLVVNCAKGGSSVDEWQPGDSLYRNFVNTVNSKKQSGYILSGVCLFQGERDSYETSIYQKWSDLTMNFLNSFMTETNSLGVRIAIAQLGKQPTDRPRPYWKNIQTQQVSIINRYENFKLVRTSTISPYYPSSGPHYSATAYEKIAKLFQQKILE